jgi:uncharacterized 2Fe-2S/4Fe-4S cluster protein (DUF4445 family)
MPVRIEINGKSLTTEKGPSVFDCAERVDVRVPTSCRKQGRCRECIVEVQEGMECLSPRTEEEAHLTENYRLSCRARIVADEGHLRCHTMRRGSLKIETRGRHLPGVAGQVELDPAVTRDGSRVLLDGEEIAQSDDPIYGLAVDLGTTTVVMWLIDLETGDMVASQAFENPQAFGGSDVMSRIRYDTDHGEGILQRTLLAYMRHVIDELPCKSRDIYEMIITGNATMRDMFFGLSVYSIGQTPYRSITELENKDGKRRTTALSENPRKFALPMHPNGRVYGLPLISGHVGADTAACLLAINMQHEERLVALMDIGTNTELLVGNKEQILCTSCPAGPAFEGGELSCGMPGLEGAIERVKIEDDGTVRISVIGDINPVGICGSGLVDTIGELLRTERMDRLGRFSKPGEPFWLDKENHIFLEEKDVSLLAQAKGANITGVRLVLRKYGIDFNDLDVFYLAGGFAKHLDIDAARRMGLIPNIPAEKIIQVGNASIEGAAVALKSVKRRRELEDAILNATHVRLETDPEFFDYFVEGCQYYPADTAEVPIVT